MKNITVTEMAEIHKQNPDVQFIDVRETDEYAEVHAAGTVNIPMSEIIGRLHEIDTNEEVYVICRSGGRSLKVCEYLQSAAGAEHLVNVEGGTLAWVASELPTDK
jgi:rhodanese-related sulfurtransferase